MIYDEDPLRRRPRESTARRLRHERCVWMARETTKWPSTRWPITKIMSSDGCNGNRVPLEMGPWYDFREFGCHLGNVGWKRSRAPVLPFSPFPDRATTSEVSRISSRRVVGSFSRSTRSARYRISSATGDRRAGGCSARTTLRGSARSCASAKARTRSASRRCACSC